VKAESQEEAKTKNIQIEGFTAQCYAEELEQIAHLIDDGKVMPVISKVMALEQAAEAQKLSEEGHVRGKIVLEVI